MPWIDTATLERNKGLGEMVALQVYNGLDCCVTFEVRESQQRDLATIPHADNVSLIYDFERGLQAPLFAMQRRGVLVDRVWRGIVRNELSKELDLAYSRFCALAEAIWGIPMKGKFPLNPALDRFGKPDRTKPGFALNYNSPTQLKMFFYETLGIPPIFVFKGGEKKISVDREALEKLQEFKYAAIFARYIIHMRDLKKKIDVLSKALDPDFRMRCSYHVAGTETGRLSSSTNPFGTGDNLQNWTKKMRRAIVADKGKKFVSIDLAQAESFCSGGEGYLASRKRSRAYLDACRSGDLHTSVCKMVWPGLSWSGDLKKDKDVAESKFYHHHTHRDMAKRLGHGSNYYGKPFQMAKQVKIQQSLAETFQLKYFTAFPELPAWHRDQKIQLQTKGFTVTPLGRLRHFFGRADDDATLRKAIAHKPQSTVGDALNLGLWKVWHELELEQHKIEMLLQVHDNIIFQVDDDPDDPLNDEKQSAIINRALELLQVPIRYDDELVLIPADVEVGWNWCPVKVDKNNVDGLVGWKGPGSDSRKRQHAPDAAGLDRVLL